MRIRQIGLKSVLHFDDFQLNFSSASGLHLLYGPNETGKSTLLKSLLDLLFGGKLDDGMRELYPTNQPHLSGLVEDEDSNTYLLERKKYYSNLVLTDASTVSEERLEALLGGYDRERYTLLFGFDHERLRKGGDNLLQSGGDAGVTLFEAGGGIQHLQRLQELLSLKSGQLLDQNFGARSAKLLNRAWQAYKKAEEETRRVGLRGDAWHQVRDEIEALNLRMADFASQRDKLRLELKQMERVQRVRDAVTRVQHFRSELDGFKSIPVLTADEDAYVIKLLSDLEEAFTAVQSQEAHLTRLNDAVAAIPVAEQVLLHGKSIDGLADRVREVETAQNTEIPRLQQAVSSKEAQVTAQLRNLAPGIELPAVESLRVPFVVKDELDKIAAALEHIQQEKKSAQDRALLYKEEVSALDQELSTIGEVPDITDLQRFIVQARAEGNLDETLSHAKRTITTKRQQVDAMLRRQTVWTGTAEALLVAPIPLAQTLDGFYRRWTDLAQAIKQGEARLSEAEAQLTRLNHELDELEQAGHVPDEAELEAARRHRDTTWQAVKNAWTTAVKSGAGAQLHVSEASSPNALDMSEMLGLPEPALEDDAENDAEALPASMGATESAVLAGTYEALVIGADGVSDALRREANRVAHRNELLRQIARGIELRSRIQNELDASKTAHGELNDEWTRLWARADITPLAPEEMRAWRIESYQPVVEALEQIAEWEQTLVDLQVRFQQGTEQLAGALCSLGVTLTPTPTSWMTYVGHAERVMTELRDKFNKRAHKTDQWTEAKRRLSTETKRVTEVDAELAQLLERWANLRKANPTLPDDAQIASRYVAELQQLFQEVARLQQMQEDVAAKLEHCAAFERDALTLATLLGESLEAFATPARFVRDVVLRLQEARDAASSIRTLRSEIAQTETILDRHKDGLTTLQSEAEALLTRHGCTAVAELRDLVATSEKYKAVWRELNSAMAQARMTGDHIAFDVLEEEVTAAGDADIVREAISRFESELQAMEAQMEETKQTLWEQQQKLAAWDGTQADAAKFAQEAAGHLADVDVHWNEYLRVELARRLLQRAIDTFRTQNESTVLESASSYFSALTLGKYRGLVVDYEDNVPVVLAHAKDGRFARVGQLSDGTRDQLFLALRLAFVDQHLRHGNPLPLVMDDILVHFDDDRARATLEVLHEMSAKTQIIYFTHQQSVVGTAHHLRDISRLHYHDLTHIGSNPGLDIEVGEVLAGEPR